MGLQTNVYRRGATYVWRKRLPARLGGMLLQISLRTNDPLTAKRLASILGVESPKVFDAMVKGLLSLDDARRLLQAAIADAFDRITLTRANMPDTGTPDAWRQSLQDDWAMGKAYEMCSYRGAAAHPITAEDVRDVLTEGRDMDAVRNLGNNVAIVAQSFAHDPKNGPNTACHKLTQAITKRRALSQSEVNHGRQLYMRGRGAAYQVASKGEIRNIDSAKAEAFKMATGTDVSPDEAVTHPAPVVTAIPNSTPDDAPMYDPSIKAVADRLMADKLHSGISTTYTKQMESVFNLFIEISGASDIRHVKQAHFSKFNDILKALPKSYRKSPADKNKTLQQIITAAGKDAVGLSTTTINRNLKYFEQLLTKAESEGLKTAEKINLKILSARKTTRARDERPAFTADDVQKLFLHPVWHGSHSPKRWQETGSRLAKDGLYWVPMIAALTGARREEIAALKAAEIIEVDGIPAFEIKENANRGLKNLVSKRLLPLHPQLIAAGLIRCAQDQITEFGPDADLFADLKPPKGGISFGDQLDYRFRKLVQHQLGSDGTGKAFHSFRHYIATQLGRMPDVGEQTRKDILGHSGGSITAERYTETAPLATKLQAIRKLPNLPI